MSTSLPSLDQPSDLDALAAAHARARRDRLVALWAAGRRGLDEGAAAAFAETLVRRAGACEGEDAQRAWVERSLSAFGMTPEEISTKIRDFQIQAELEVFAVS